MKRKLEIVMCSLLFLFCVCACAIDSESLVPLIMAVCSLIGIVVCNVIYIRKGV